LAQASRPRRGRAGAMPLLPGMPPARAGLLAAAPAMWGAVGRARAAHPSPPPGARSGGVRQAAGAAYVAGAFVVMGAILAGRRFGSARRAAGKSGRAPRAQPGDGGRRGQRCLARAAQPGADVGQQLQAAKANFAIWTPKRAEVSALLASWAEVAEPGDMKDFFAAMCKLEVPKGWLVWAVSESAHVPSGVGGFYIIPPCEPQALVFMEAIDSTTNCIQHFAIDPRALGPGVRSAIQDWLESMKPKRSAVQYPAELVLFGMDLNVGGGAQVSRGL